MIYHSTTSLTDGEAQKISLKYRNAVQSKGGSLDVSRGFPAPAVLVLSLPPGEGLASELVPDVEWKNFEEEEK